MVEKTDETKISKIIKRDGRIVDFDQNKITEAIWKAAQSVGGKDRNLAEKLSSQVVELLKKQLKPGEIPHVEQVQDLVEKVLVENGHYKTAKAYILYRALHNQIRELVDSYLDEKTWLVKENANTTFSLQALNFHISSQVISQYWLHRIYNKTTPELRDAHVNGDIHIHNLGILGPYCVGWDLQDLLLTGFTGVRGKISSKPAKHLRSALGQVVNFMFTLQGEAAGAQAFSNFDTFLAPFIRYDGLDYKTVKQIVQEFMFNMNVPTRVGFQCLSEDTKILTPEGWKSYNEIKKGDIIYTFNLNTGKLEKKPIKSIFIRKYKGSMYNLRNRSQDQLISPHHRVVRQIFNTNKYKLETIEDVLQMKSPIPIPVVAENNNPDINVSDEKLKFLAWIFSEGTIEKNGSRRVSIYQSQTAHPENYGEIISLLNNLNLEFTTRYQTGLGTCVHMRLSPDSSKIVHQWLGSTRKILPDFIFSLSKRQARLFLETYIKGDGWKEKHRKRITVTDEKILEGLEALAVLAGYNFSVRKRKPQGISKKVQYILTLTETKTDYIKSIKKVDYEGIIWSVHTENETVIAKRNGQVFITGNTPFTNITLDLKVPKFMENEPVIIGGKLLDVTYGDFQEEMNIFNKALAEIMLEGDAVGRVFTFPIPTINITKDFNWEDGAILKIFETSAKYGIPYFANFVNSDMNPEDVRSMCCHLRLDKRELKKRGGGLFGANPLTGSIGVVTINMPRIGYLSKDEREFFERLDKMMEISKRILEIKRAWLEKLTEKGLYPYAKFYLRKIKEGFGQYWKNHFNTIGLIGMNEACLNFLGCTIGDKDGLAFAEKVLDFMRKRLEDFQVETGNIYNLEATPAEGTSYSLAKIDKQKYPDIIVANEEEVKKGAKPYYTNSSHLPVYYTDDLWEYLRLQDPLQVKYTGGTVVHVWMGEANIPVESLINLVRKICNNFRLPYFTITPTFSICPEHGYIPREAPVCPNCGRKTEVYSRVVGYLRPVDQWNEGKQEEFKQRKKFDKVFQNL